MTKPETSRRNGQCGRGPVSADGKRRASQNARKHQLFAKTIRFSSDEEEQEFVRCRADVIQHYQPRDGYLLKLAEEVAIWMWKKHTVLSLIERQLRQYERPVINTVLAKFLSDSSLPELPIPGVVLRGEEQKPAKHSPFECSELVVKMYNRTGQRTGERDIDEDDVSTKGETTDNAVEVEAKLSNSLNTLMRYHAMIERSFDRAVNRLREELRHNPVGKEG